MMRTPDDDKAKAASIPPAARALFSWASAKEGAGEAPPAAVRFQSPPHSGGVSSGTSEIGGLGIEGGSEVDSGAARARGAAAGKVRIKLVDMDDRTLCCAPIGGLGQTVCVAPLLDNGSCSRYKTHKGLPAAWQAASSS